MVICLFQVRSFFQSPRRKESSRTFSERISLTIKLLSFMGSSQVTTSKLWRQVGLENPSILQSMAALMFHDGNSLHIWFVFCEKVSFSVVD
ncbi:unnamed protein product [Brassica rapa]|uniref:Uncharacterized protein n=1 Tax=Brassica campestris TaxID=3711 RepID=A0A8D9H7A4_BRACM|nr:unnamed protein product [Brassica rapa]